MISSETDIIEALGKQPRMGVVKADEILAQVPNSILIKELKKRTNVKLIKADSDQMLRIQTCRPWNKDGGVTDTHIPTPCSILAIVEK